MVRLSLPARWRSSRWRSPLWRRGLAELALLLVIGAFMGTIGPYGTGALPTGRLYVYWIAAIAGGGMIGVSLDETLGRRAGGFWPRLAVSSLLMTPPVTGLVMMLGRWLADQSLTLGRYLGLLWQVLVISAPVMALRALAWRTPRTVVETRTVVAPPLPEAEAAFRRRLSARRRGARLIAVEAHDHYLRVHTDAGPELVTLRFADALGELAGAHGFRTHRSWWIAADAIEAVRWRRGAGEARLSGGLEAPVSRSHAPALKEAGW
jgi:LytTr DNA-binding domain